jgi:hypothetical protein
MEHEIRIKSTREIYGWLTTNSPMSNYGIPVFRLAQEFDDPDRRTDYGPTDLIMHGEAAETFGPEPAAETIARWVEGQREALPDEVVDAARRFCAQWPEGPQID